MIRLGLLVNPDAGLGGKLGLKGSDGKAELARSMGADDRSGPRLRKFLEHFSLLHRGSFDDISWITSEGKMGSKWFPKDVDIGLVTTVHESNEHTSFQDTEEAVEKLINHGIDLLIYAGGDGTTRDIIAKLNKLEYPKLPVIGVPTGVKMYSGSFAASPKAAAEVLSAWIRGDLLTASTEVLDLDEERYRNGEWIVRHYAEAVTPSSPRWMQGSKQRVEASGEGEIIEGLAEHIGEILIKDSRLIIWGSGGTLGDIGEYLGFNLTTLGMDATLGQELIGLDLDEKGILNLLDSHNGEITVLLSPMGGQGFLIGRGNLQLSSSVIRKVGIDNILGVVTPAKLLTVRKLRIETGDEDLDAEFALKRYMKVLQGYRTTRVLPISID
jgi:predicted polyphosphate/ATP-dependent NAD kinase|tara:strand:+ start:301 stop:1449 length:1149 start_codon:yes stop_codon:yes gene_type:complete